MQKYLQDPSLPIWVSLNQKYTELYRDLKGIYKGACPQLAEAFGYPEVDSFWGRHYLLWHGGEPITMLYEVYSQRSASIWDLVVCKKINKLIYQLYGWISLFVHSITVIQYYNNTVNRSPD